MRTLRITLRLVTAALAVLLVGTFGLPMPQAAAIDVIPAPSPWGGGGGGGGPGGRSQCFPGGAGVHGSRYFQYSPWCASGGAWYWTGARKYCPTGFEVFRFYGTVANPVQAWTHGKTNINSHECNGTKLAASHSGHPEDGRQGVWPGTGAWRYDIGAEPGAPGLNVVSWGLTRANNAYGAQQAFTTISSLNRGGDCRALETSNTRLRSYQWGGSNYNAPEAASIRSWLTAQYRTAATHPNSNDVLSLWSKAEFDVAGTDPRGQIVTGDNWHCSSAFDFMAQVPTGANPYTTPQARILGTCIIPTQRFSWDFHLHQWGVGATPYHQWVAAASDPDLYTGWTRDADQNPALSGDPYGILNRARRWGSTSNYRSAIVSILNQTGSRWDWYAGHSRAHPARWAGAWGPVRDAWVPVVAANEAMCTASYAGTWSATSSGTPDSTDSANPQAMELTVTTPEVGQVGGQLRPPVIISTRAGRIMCANNTPCPTTGDNRVRLVSVNNLRLNVTPPADTQIGVRSGMAFTHNRGNGQIGLDFFTGTRGSSQVVASVPANATATVEYTVRGSGMTVCWTRRFERLGWSGCEEIGGNTTRTERRNVPLRVTYTPDDRFPVISATATPIEDRQGD